MTILEKLFSGDIDPSVRYIIEGSEYQKISKRLMGEIDKLYSELSREEKQICEKIADLYGDLCVIAERERYIDGFHTGAKLMLELISFKSENFYC